MLYVLAAVAVFITCLLLSTVSYYLVYTKNEMGSVWRFYVGVWGMKIPVAKRAARDAEKEKDKEKEKDAEKEKDTEKEIKKSFGEIRESLKEKKEAFDKILKYLREKAIKTGLTFDMEIGTGCAPTTAILVGISWGFYYGLLGLISAMVPLESHKESIRSNFEKKVLKIKFEGVVSFKLAHIIIIFAKTVKAAMTHRKSRRSANV